MKTKLLYFIGGVVGGALGMWVAMEKKYQKRLDEEVAEVKKAYSEKKNVIVFPKCDSFCDSFEAKKMKTITKNDEDEAKNAEKIGAEKAKKIAEENAKRKAADIESYRQKLEENGYVDTHKTEYNLFSKPPKVAEIDNGIDEGEDLDIVDTTPSEDAPGPYVLETDELSTASEKFVNEQPYFEKVTLYLYDDGVLCSEEEEIITNIANTVGHDALGRIGEYEPDVVYVRNEQTSTDYEVIRQYTDFASIPHENE